MKRYLFTPGPTPVPPEVLAAVGAPVLHHRSPDFLPIYERVLTRLREVCRTESDVLLFGASGTGAFESAVANLVSPGEPHLVVSAGSFGERWVAMTTAYGADVDVLRYAWGETPDADDLQARLREREANAVWLGKDEDAGEFNPNSGGWTVYLTPGLRCRFNPRRGYGCLTGNRSS